MSATWTIYIQIGQDPYNTFRPLSSFIVLVASSPLVLILIQPEMFSVSLLFLILFQLSVFYFVRISFLPCSLFLLAIFCKTYLSQIIGNIVSCLGIWNKSLLSNVSWKLNRHRSNSSFIVRLCFIIYSCSLFL